MRTWVLGRVGILWIESMEMVPTLRAIADGFRGPRTRGAMLGAARLDVTAEKWRGAHGHSGPCGETVAEYRARIMGEVA